MHDEGDNLMPSLADFVFIDGRIYFFNFERIHSGLFTDIANLTYKVTLSYFDMNEMVIVDETSDEVTVSQQLVGIQFVKNVLHEDKIESAYVLLVLQNQVRVRRLRHLVKGRRTWTSIVASLPQDKSEKARSRVSLAGTKKDYWASLV